MFDGFCELLYSIVLFPIHFTYVFDEEAPIVSFMGTMRDCVRFSIGYQLLRSRLIGVQLASVGLKHVSVTPFADLTSLLSSPFVVSEREREERERDLINQRERQR